MNGLKMHVSKWGNSLAIRLPAALVQELNLKAGDEINIRSAGQFEFVVEREMTREEAIAKMRAMRTPLPPGFRFDREEANAR
jgi:antitoxin MazE